MKLGLCFSGGGARGAYQIGACMALKEAGILDHVQAFSGTSIGSANAALVASRSLEDIRDIWLSTTKDTLKKTESVFRRLLHEGPNALTNKGVYEIEAMERLLIDSLDFDELRKKRVYATISCAGKTEGGFNELLSSAFKHYVKHERLVEYSRLWEEPDEMIIKHIVASCSIPFFFKPMPIDGKQYVDGGMYDNLPVKPLIEEGCDTIIVLELIKMPNLHHQHYKDITFHTIKHKGSLGMMLNFEQDQSRIRYQLGYDDCKKYLEEHKIV